MTRVTGVFMNGTAGNAALYVGMDKNLTFLKGHALVPTLATKIRNENFGIASRASSPLRKALSATIPFPTDRSMQSRFSGSIAKWLCLSDVEALAPCDPAPYIR